MKSKIRVAIIGYGVVGKRRRKFIAKNKNYSLVAVSDIQFLQNTLKKKKLVFYKYYKDLLNKEKLDAVFVTLPNYLASTVTKECIKRKLHVFCEKPPARNVKEILEVKDILKKYPRIKLKYGFNHRYHSSIKMAKKIIEKGSYGKILNFRCLYGKSKIVTYEASEWRAKKRYSGGGILIDQGIHLLDILIFLNGKFEKVKSFISKKFWNYDVEDNAFALLKDKKGVIASIHSTATQWQHKFRIEICLRNALIELQGILSSTKSYGKESLKIIKRENKSFKGSSSQKNFFFKKDNSWREEIEEFSKIIKKNLKVKTGNIFDAIESMKLVEKIYNADKRR
jgi:predicted dehydrogenase